MRRHQDTVVSATSATDKGSPVYAAQVRVFKADGSAAQLYSDNGITPITQPILTSGLGVYFFYITDGTYSIVVRDPDGNNPVTLPDVQIYDIAVAIPNIVAAGAAAVGTVNTAGTTQVTAVNAAGTTQLAAVNGAGTTQVGNINAAASAVLTNGAFTYQAATTALALSGTIAGQLAAVPQESGSYQDVYSHTGSYMALSRTDPIGGGFLLEQQRAIGAAILASPQFLTQPDIHIVPNDALKNRNAIIPNRTGGVTPTRNLYQLANQIVGGTVTAGYSGHDLRIQLASGAFATLFNEYPTSTDYHVRFQALSTAGAGAQSFKILKNGATVLAPTYSITESGALDVEFTATAQSIAIYAQSAAADILIDGLVIQAIEIAAPQVPVPASGALVNSAYLSKPGQMTVAHGALIGPYPGFVKVNADGMTASSIAAGTMIATIKKNGASTNGYPGPFMAASPAAGNITLGEDSSGVMRWDAPGASGTLGNASMKFDGKGFVTLSCSYNATRSMVYCEGVPILATPGPGGSAASVARFWWGGGDGYASSRFNGEYGSLSIWKGETLSDVAMSQAVKVHRSETTSGGALPGIRNMLLVDADSIAYGQLVGADAAYPVLSAIANSVICINAATPGSSLTTILTREALMMNRIRACVAQGIRPIVYLAIGVNGTTDIPTYQALVSRYRAAGGYVVLATASGSLATSDAAKAALNASIRTITCDGIVDIAAKIDPVSGFALGTQAAANTTALFPDNLHPSAYGNGLFRDVLTPVVAAGMQ